MSNATNILPPLPTSWSALTWQQLCDVWTAKMRYGGNQDVAACAALLALAFGEGVKVNGSSFDGQTGESTYTIEAADGRRFTTTPRELAHLAKQALPWLQYPYGDPGKEAVKDDKGKVVEESVPPHRGYVSGMRDAMILPVESIDIEGRRYALPQAAMNNLTWEQYRSLQPLPPQLFQEGVTEDDALRMQAEFLSYCLVPEGEPDQTGNPFHYSPVVAERMQPLFRRLLTEGSPLFQICFQTYQTAMGYYREAFPLLFQGDGKQDALKDALVGEVDTLNAIMKYQGYIRQQDVYDTNLLIVFSVLNTMTKEAKEIEKMNSKIKRK